MSDPTASHEHQVVLARRLAELRASRRGLTQEALARAFSIERKVTGPTVSSWESERSPKTPPLIRLDAYARFFATERSMQGPKMRPLTVPELEEEPDELDQYRELREELLTLLHAGDEEETEPVPEPEAPQRTLLQFDEGDIIIVCPETPEDVRGKLAEPDSPNFSRLHRFADADALIEIFGHVRALNPDRKVFYRTAGRAFVSGELQSHLILIGGIGWSRTTERILSKLADFPISQIEDPDKRIKTGEVFRVSPANGEEKIHYPQVDESTGEIIEDVALIARVRNPYNSGRTLTIFNGIHSRGVVGAALAVTDETIRTGNQEYLAERFPSGDFGLLMRVDILEGVPLAPDFRSEAARLFEWSPGDKKA